MDYYQEESRKWQASSLPLDSTSNPDHSSLNTGLSIAPDPRQAPSAWHSSSMNMRETGFAPNLSLSHTSSTASRLAQRKQKKVRMQTGCIPCLTANKACSPHNPGCRLALSDEWYLNDSADQAGVIVRENTNESKSLDLFRVETRWPKRTWRERHCLNFFVNFSAPQMAGFFDSGFWMRSVIQASYIEPAIMHGLIAIGSLHEGIMQRAFADERRKNKAISFALEQCNRAIACLTSSDDQRQDSSGYTPPKSRVTSATKQPSFRLLLTSCVLFTCFEAMQGRCDSAVQHAMQGRRLLDSSNRPHLLTMDPDDNAIEDMRVLIDRLEAQAVSLVDKVKRPQVDMTPQTKPLPPITRIYSIDHAQHTLHHAMNSVMRFMQAFHPSAPRDHIAMTMAEKHLRYSPWFVAWNEALEKFIASSPKNHPSNMNAVDHKRWLVLKTNHLVCMMLASVDQSIGPSAYDAYENNFRQIVELAREVLASFSCPPLPTLKPGGPGTPYLSFSLWVTDPLWMVISRCRSPSIRQAAFTLLSQHPRQEGIWHSGPAAQSQFSRRTDQNTTTTAKGGQKSGGSSPSSKGREGSRHSSLSENDASASERTSSPDTSRRSQSTMSAASSASATNVEIPAPQIGEVPKNISEAPLMGNMKIRGEWLDLQAHSQGKDHSLDKRDMMQMLGKSRFQPRKVWPTTFRPVLEVEDEPAGSNENG